MKLETALQNLGWKVETTLVGDLDEILVNIRSTKNREEELVVVPLEQGYTVEHALQFLFAEIQSIGSCSRQFEKWRQFPHAEPADDMMFCYYERAGQKITRAMRGDYYKIVAETLDGPRWEHDCKTCIYLGQYENCDLYYCPQGNCPTVIARYSHSDTDYQSGLRSATPGGPKALQVAREKAIEKRLIKEAV